MPPKPKLGRPLKFSSVMAFGRKVDEYFQTCGDKPTITGLATHLGLSRKQLIEYGNRADYGNVVKGAKSLIEAKVEERLLYSKHSPAGLIFWLKNQGWSDTQQIDVNDISGKSKDQLIDMIKGIAKPQVVKRGKTGTDG